MKVTLSKNGTEITSINYKAHEPFTGATVLLALTCLETRFLMIPNADAVIKEFINQKNRQDNIPNIKYIADVNGDVWTIDVETPMCQACGEIEVDNEGELCSNCKKKSVITDFVMHSGQVIRAAFDASGNWKNIEICSICKAELVNGKCPNGHIIVR